VDEPLQEIALRGLGGAPRILELLVRREVLARSNQLDAPRKRFHRAKLTRYAQAVATILLCGVDLFFRGKLEALLPGHRFVTTDSIDPPDLVIADMARIDCDEVADAWPDIPILGFTNHNDAAGLRAGHAAGFDQVLVKSALDERAPQLVDELLATVE
jgi:CheY-like chemotaxis protein